MNFDERFMQRALELAKKGWPAVAPNPQVGCVIVHNEKIVAEGYHEQYGAPHAEVNAINALPAAVDPRECTLYVSLEPCDHQGKTPPCTGLILEKHFGSVVVAMKDPNPLVAGKGLEKMKQAGLKVISGVLENEARLLNQQFVTFHERKRPYIILKWAITGDGFISRPRGSAREDNFITRKEAQIMVHQLRAETMGIMVGKSTVLADDPQLTVRHVAGKNPVRIVIDRILEIPESFKIYNAEAPTLIFNCIRNYEDGNVKWIKIENKPDLLPLVLSALHREGIQSLLVEGGSRVLQGFIEKGLWDETLVFQNPDLIFGAGLKGPVFPLKNTFELVGEDKLFHYSQGENTWLEGH